MKSSKSVHLPPDLAKNVTQKDLRYAAEELRVSIYSDSETNDRLERVAEFLDAVARYANPESASEA